MHIQGCQVIIFLSPEEFFTFTNSVDIDEMQHYAAFHLGLHSFYIMYLFRGFSIQRVKR